MIKKFEKFIPDEDGFTLPEKDVIYFYEIYVEKSIDKFNVALEKLGVKKYFYNSYDNWKERLNFYLRMVSDNDRIILIVDGNSFILENSYDELEFHYNFDEFTYGGKIKIKDYEVGVNKYNL